MNKYDFILIKIQIKYLRYETKVYLMYSTTLRIINSYILRIKKTDSVKQMINNDRGYFDDSGIVVQFSVSYFFKGSAQSGLKFMGGQFVAAERWICTV